jgi:nicotinamide riboside transporter PnuC
VRRAWPYLIALAIVAAALAWFAWAMTEADNEMEQSQILQRAQERARRCVEQWHMAYAWERCEPTSSACGRRPALDEDCRVTTFPTQHQQ